MSVATIEQWIKALGASHDELIAQGITFNHRRRCIPIAIYWIWHQRLA